METGPCKDVYTTVMAVPFRQFNFPATRHEPGAALFNLSWISLLSSPAEGDPAGQVGRSFRCREQRLSQSLLL